MKIFGKYLLMSAIAVGLWSCSDDAPEVNNPDESVDEVYMSVRIQLPTSGGSRSETTDPGNASDDGVEIGKDYENEVSKVLLVLADADNNSFISYKTIDNLSQNGENLVVNGSFNKSVLVNYIESKNATTAKVNVYAFCNYTDDLKEYFSKIQRGEAEDNWINKTYNVTKPAYSRNGNNEPIWHKRSFLMANESMAKCTLPELADINSGKYNNTSNPYRLTQSGAVKVQRSVARFDFMDGSDGDCTYTFAKDNGVATLQVKLTEMSLVNLSKSFYHLIRTSDTGLNTDITLCGKDMPTTTIEDENVWVVDTDANEKNGVHESVYQNFFYWFGDGSVTNLWKPEEWDTWSIAEVLKGDDQNFDGWTGSDNKREGYKIWRYATENTIPAPAANQKNGITTGIIFKGVLTATDAAPEALKAAMEAGKTIYSYKRTLYGTWADIKTFIDANKDNPDYTDLIAAYNKAELNGGEDKAVDNEFTRYTYNAADEGYPMYYPYWNRHNDNMNNSVMGHMEFQVVRNNIYKLRVTDISALGHPTKPGDDPDPFDPEDPDEKEDVYFTVDVAIVPWVVRVNDITFP